MQHQEVIENLFKNILNEIKNKDLIINNFFKKALKTYKLDKKTDVTVYATLSEIVFNIKLFESNARFSGNYEIWVYTEGQNYFHIEVMEEKVSNRVEQVLWITNNIKSIPKSGYLGIDFELPLEDPKTIMGYDLLEKHIRSKNKFYETKMEVDSSKLLEIFIKEVYNGRNRTSKEHKSKNLAHFEKVS